MDELELIPIGKLLDKDFFIPAYQRGYRWQKRQVIDLLEDIIEFVNKKKEDGEFYCLQPIVVTEKEDKTWEVIDGQQRLTTLYIILSYLEDARKILFSSSEKFSISYETRETEKCSSKIFLEEILGTECIKTENIDFYHMSQAFLTIKKWFEDKKINKGNFLNALLQVNYKEIDNKELKIKETEDIANNVRFIWYEVKTKSEVEAKDIFTRINMGKIPLTNAELIKALFFINGNQNDTEKEKHQSKLAYEWDHIENTLQNKTFWFFLNKSNNSTPTKIEFIFDLIANKYKSEVSITINREKDKYYTFYVFNDLINKGKKTINQLWEEIKTYFRTFEEWFNNNEYYHLIGFLIHKDKGDDIEKIKALSNNRLKSEFKNKLIERIRSDIKSYFLNKKTTLDELTYQNKSDSQLIRDVLLLFNVITTMNGKYTKFPFERYINEKWSLEHIHAQNSEDLKTDKQRILLLKEQKTYFKKCNEEELVEKISEILEDDNLDSDSFKKLQDIIFEKYTENGSESIHSIDNMALLSGIDNSTLNNDIFPIKRDKITELDEQGSFIPICTKNVFLKYYSKEVMENTTWTKNDRNSYLKEIKRILSYYL